jgi:hypothetical protein
MKPAGRKCTLHHRHEGGKEIIIRGARKEYHAKTT